MPIDDVPFPVFMAQQTISRLDALDLLSTLGEQEEPGLSLKHIKPKLLELSKEAEAVDNHSLSALLLIMVGMISEDGKVTDEPSDSDLWGVIRSEQGAWGRGLSYKVKKQFPSRSVPPALGARRSTKKSR